MDLTPVLPIVLVVVFWVLVGILAVWFFGRTLRLPTESEIEAEREHAEAHTGAAPTTAHP